mgnify:CR=1 FL=1
MEENSDDEETTEEILQDYNQSFMMKISQSGKVSGNEMTFDYSFLAPPGIQKPQKQYSDREKLHLDSNIDTDVEHQNLKETHKDSISYNK